MARLKLFLFLQFVFFSALPVIAQVDQVWVRRYNGPDNHYDYAYALVVDAAGNVYVTGASGSVFQYATIKYAPNGDTLWVRGYDVIHYTISESFALAPDAFGNVYVTGYVWSSATGQDYATVKFAPNGDTLWVRRYNTPFGTEAYADDVPNALALDTAGNVYLAGYSYGGSSITFDYATIKYTPNGDTLWVRRYDGTGSDVDNAKDLAVDAFGNVYVTGYSRGSGTSEDYATIKYAPNGDTLWVQRYNRSGNGNDYAKALAVDVAGNAYVTGLSWGSYTSFYDFATIKYAPNGDTLWVRFYDGGGNGSDEPNAIVVDGSGNVYVTGKSKGDSLTADDYATIKYAPDGELLWVRRYNGPGSGNDNARALAVDAFGNVYVTGQSRGSETSEDYATVKYAPNGDLLWVTRYNGPKNLDDYATSLALDSAGNVYVTGYSAGGGGVGGTLYDYATIKYAQYTCLAVAGDNNANGNVNLTDITFEVNYIFKGGAAPSPGCRGDANASGGSGNLSDIIYLVNYVFKGGPAPVKAKECCL